MAEWRSRGYVADSDDEEESQESFSPARTAKETADSVHGSPRINKKGAAEDDEGSRKGSDLEDLFQVEKRGKSGGGNAKTNSSITSTLRGPKSSSQSQDNGDLDELQADHYPNTASAQSLTDVLLGAQVSANRPLLTESSFSSRLTDHDQRSLPPFKTLDSIHDETLADQLRKSPAGQDSFKESRDQIISPTFSWPHAMHVDNSNAEVNRIARTLRNRKPIQMRPYAVEGATYRQSCTARGMKPLRIAQMEAEAAGGQLEESQNQEYQGDRSQEPEEDSNPNDLRSSSPVETQDTSSQHPSTNYDIFEFGDDELPNVDSLLSDRPQKFVRNGHKRQNVGTAAFRMPPGMRRVMHKYPHQETSNLTDADDDVIYNMPLSPPRSASQSSIEAAPAIPPLFQSPPKVSKVTLPTPVTSSELRKPPVLEISEDDLSDNSPRVAPRISTSSESSGSEESDSTPSPPKHVSHHLERVQRKIRGVLPASWLKIDLKAQKKYSGNITSNRQSPSPRKPALQRGIARPVFSSRSKGPDSTTFQDDLFPLSDGEDSVVDNNHLQHDLPARKTLDLEDESPDFMGSRLGEAAEDDKIDAMLPSATRTRGPSGKRKWKYKMTSINKSELYAPSAGNNLSGVIQDRQRKRLSAVNRKSEKDRRKRPYFQLPQLSILDTPSFNDSPKALLPPFLKIASRVVRSRNDQGRHSPSRKYLRLATKEDDEETNETLRTWREGTIVPMVNNRTKRRPARQPLYPRSVNNPYLPLKASRVKESDEPENRPQESPIEHQLPSSKRRKLQSSLDHLIHRQPRIHVESSRNETIQQRMEQFGTRKPLSSSIRAENVPRPAMLETSKGNAHRSQEKVRFQQDLSRIDNFDNESGIPNVLRLYNDDRRQPSDISPSRKDGSHATPQSRKSAVSVKKPIIRRNRKHRPIRVDPAGPRFRRSSTPTIIDDYPDTIIAETASDLPQRGIVVTGLGSFGTQYSNDFGIIPLPTGTCFHESTFLGRGLLAKGLKLNSLSTLDSSRGYAVLQFQGQTCRWGPWNETVSSELGMTITWISQVIQAQQKEEQSYCSGPDLNLALSTLEAVVAYLSNHLWFLDPIDRSSCVQRCKTLITMLSHDLGDVVSGDKGLSSDLSKPLHMATILKLRMVVAVFAVQIHRISNHDFVPLQLQDEVRLLLQSIAQDTVNLAMLNGLGEFEESISRSQHSNTIEQIFRNEVSIESFVVGIHVLPQDTNCSIDFNKFLQIAPSTKSTDVALDIAPLEVHWKCLFTLLPFFEFDADGILETGRRFKVSFDNWLLVKRLINPILDVSLKNPREQPANFNAYLRAVFRRCLHLVNDWGWRRCESIIGTLFDFFARNQLSHLRNEESHGSPSFLEHLAENPTLNAEPEDRCFHLLLKIIGAGIKHMRQIYPEKKIRDMVWRLMPNHGRSHPKEEAIRQADLDALRNHHDLLCTLYWASPSGCRPRLTVIRNLVQLESSHREACHLNIRAWFNLVRFQLSTDEPISCLNGFKTWFDDLVEQILRQHRLARTEAEDQVRSAHYAEGLIISNDLLESTIAKNQRQVEAILSDALISLKLAIGVADNVQAAATLVSPMLSRVFELFDGGKPRINKTVIEALEVLSALVSKIEALQQPRSHIENDDSQDYGDWPTYDDIETFNDEKAAVRSPLQNFQESLRHLLSNAFGSDIAPDDAFLLKLVVVWVDVAQVLVRSGMRSWNEYLDRFGNDSWYSLRDTEQTRKFTALVLATLIRNDQELCSDHATFLLRSWMGSLVERESLLKFESQLTEALLNANVDSPLLKNVPFWTNTASGRFEVSAAVFRERRISLISSVLSNMRESVENATSQRSTDALQLRQEYREMLKHLMGTMKQNYQALGQGSNLRGSYVTFAQKVVELLQQHTSTICPVDRFFTDNDAFPLPATDPTYVVGQLKNYALRLQEARIPKQLASFLLSVSERAAVDGQQHYFVNQLRGAPSYMSEGGRSSMPVLLSFLVRAILPAYLEVACTSSGSYCGWILALPYVQSLQTTFPELLLALDGADPQSVTIMRSIFHAFLGSMRKSFGDLLSQSGLLEQAGVLKLVASCYSTTMSLLPVIDYVVRLREPSQHLVKRVDFLKEFAFHIQNKLQNHDAQHYWETEDDEEDAAYADTRHFATQELDDSLAKNWKYEPDGQQYSFTRGGSRREVLVDIGMYEEEKANLLMNTTQFLVSVEAMPALMGDNDDSLMLRRKPLSGADQLIF